VSETARILDQFRSAYRGPAWHGPALLAVLSDVDARIAAARPLANAHTIWEIVLHIAIWMSVATRRMAGEQIPSLAAYQDWPSAPPPSKSSWRETLDALAKAEAGLEAAVEKLTDARLNDTLLGDRPWSTYETLHGAVQHTLYHAGQIALLKKAARATTA